MKTRRDPSRDPSRGRRRDLGEISRLDIFDRADVRIDARAAERRAVAAPPVDVDAPEDQPVRLIRTMHV